MKTTLKTTIALALLSLIIGCGEQEPEISGNDIYRAGYSEGMYARILRDEDDAGDIAAAQVDYKEHMREGANLKRAAMDQGMSQREVERWYDLGKRAARER